MHCLFFAPFARLHFFVSAFFFFVMILGIQYNSQCIILLLQMAMKEENDAVTTKTRILSLELLQVYYYS